MELKIFIFWAAITLILYIAARFEYWLSDTNLRWKYFKEESVMGALHYLSFIASIIAGVLFLIYKVAVWWFQP